jgi:heterodisulfide reductase subunit B
MHESPELANKVNQALAAGGLSYEGGSLKVRHLLDVVVNDIGLDTIAGKVTRPLNGLRIAPYYGCMIVRPNFETKNGNGKSFDNTEYPMLLDRLLKKLGAEVVDFPMKAHCCGGHMTQISEATGFELIRRLVKGASDYKADMIVTLCPMCQLNLDGFQGPMNRHFKTNFNMPVLYFTQMMGLAFGMDAAPLGIGQELVDARPALAKIGVAVPQAETTAAPKKSKKDDKSLPMPQMGKWEE